MLGLLIPLFAHGQEAGWLRIDPENREDLTHFAVRGGYEDGRFKLSHEALAEWKAGAEASRIGQRQHYTWFGKVSFDQLVDKCTTSSLLLDPLHYPMDLMDLSRGTKSRQDVRLEGGFLSDIDDVWAAGVQGSVRAQHASKRKGVPYSNFGVEAELAPVATFLIDDNVGFSVSYRGRLRTENANIKGEGGESIFFDKGLRYGEYPAPGGKGAFSILELAHGFSGEFRSQEESWGLEMLWKRARAGGFDGKFRIPGSTLRAFFDYTLALDKTSHRFGVSYQRDRDQLRLVGTDGAFTSLSDRVNRNADLKYDFRILEGMVKSVSLVLDGEQVTERAVMSIYDKTVRYGGTATLLTSLPVGDFDIDANMMAGKGWWKERGAGDPSDTPGAPLRQTDDWIRQMEALMAPRIGLGGALTFHLPSVDGLYFRLDGFWRRALKASHLGGKNREAVTLTVGYDY